MKTERTIDVPPRSYQPTKAEREEQFRIDATPEQLAQSLLKPVVIKSRDVAEYRSRKRAS